MTEPEPEKTLPAAVPIRRKSQHPSVENPVNVTRKYPVALLIICLQLKFAVYFAPVFV
jgi:hypothetical protein